MADDEDDFLRFGLEREQRRLVTELRSSDTYKRLVKVNDLAVEYGLPEWGLGTISRAPPPPPPMPPPPPIPPDEDDSLPEPEEPPHPEAATPQPRHFGYGEKTKAIEQVAIGFLTERGYRAPVSEFMRPMTDAGILIGGKHPVRSLASFLSNFETLNNLRPHGYGLAAWGDTLGPRHYEFTGADALTPRTGNENEPPEGKPKGGSETGDDTPDFNDRDRNGGA